MNKKSDEELGIILTREIQSMMFNEKLTADQRVKIFCSIVRDTDIDDPVMATLAESLKAGYDYTNNARRKKIYARRERQKEYQKELRSSTKMSGHLPTSTEIVVDDSSTDAIEHLSTSTEMSVHLRALPRKGNGKGNGNNIPLNPPSGVEGRSPEAISADDIIGMNGTDDIRNKAGEIADAIEQTEAYGHMRVNRGKLMKCLVSTLKKNGGAGEKIVSGLKSWTESWKADGWAYVPGRITDWIYDEKYLQEPRGSAKEPEESAGCGACGVEIG